MDESLIAPCGMNCAVCAGYLARQHDVRDKGVRMAYCAGCRAGGKECAYLKKSCWLLINQEVHYCYECPAYPCYRLTHMDRRYRTFYRTSFTANLDHIRNRGIESLLAAENEKWRCPACGGTVCCHNGICFDCGLEKLKAKKNKYRWED